MRLPTRSVRYESLPSWKLSGKQSSCARHLSVLTLSDRFRRLCCRYCSGAEHKVSVDRIDLSPVDFVIHVHT